MNRFSKILLIIGLSMTILSVIAQNGRRDLERERRHVVKEMRDTQRKLQQTKREKKTTQARFSQVQDKLEEKKDAIADANQGINATQGSILRTKDVISALHNDVNHLKEEYAKTVRRTFRQKLNHSFLLFLFSSESFNQAFQRFQYIRQYDKFRKKQVQMIFETQQSLRHKVALLTGEKEEQVEVLQEVKEQAQNLGRELTEKEKELASLKSKENNLKENLAQQARNHERLDAAIEKYIQDELEARRRATIRMNPDNEMVLRSNRNRQKTSVEEVKPRAREEEKIPAESAASKALSSSFSSNKGKLPWPVSSGSISRTYGKQRHPDAQSVWINNNGIDIRTNNGSNVNSVFKGRVVGSQFINGINYMVIVEHGSYYSVYSNLDKVYVKSGDEISTNQAIGRLSASGDLHVEIWNGKARQNPKNWLRR
jgi:murein hydrolase activator